MSAMSGGGKGGGLRREEKNGMDDEGAKKKWGQSLLVGIHFPQSNEPTLKSPVSLLARTPVSRPVRVPQLSCPFLFTHTHYEFILNTRRFTRRSPHSSRRRPLPKTGRSTSPGSGHR